MTESNCAKALGTGTVSEEDLATCKEKVALCKVFGSQIKNRKHLRPCCRRKERLGGGGAEGRGGRLEFSFLACHMFFSIFRLKDVCSQRYISSSFSILCVCVCVKQ